MKCLVCGSSTPEPTTQKRVQSFRNASLQRGDGLADRLDKDATSFICHSSCVSSYCSKEHIQRHLKRKKKEESLAQNMSSKRMRRKSEFSFLKHCIFCGNDCEVERPSKNPSRWREAYLCRTADRKGRTSFKESILRRAKERGDEWADDVIFRTNCALSDLHAADARYHKNCMSMFFSNNPTESVREYVDEAVDDLMCQMKSDRSRIWNSRELYELYKELGGTRLSRRSLIRYLGELLHPDLLVLSSPGVASIILFRSKAASQLRIEDDLDDDCNTRAIRSLGTKIRADCMKHKPDAYSYATHMSLDSLIGECSETLLSLLAEISPNLDSTLPAAMIGHIVLSSVCNQATTLQLALSVLVNQQRNILDQLHNFGVTSSYNELRRFRISSATFMAKDERGLAQFDSKNGLVQVIADNFDTEISSQNGQKSTHGLAMIITQAGQVKRESPCDKLDMTRIRRLKWEETKSSQLSLGEVNIQHFNGNKKSEMPEHYGRRVVPTLALLASMQVSVNKAVSQDFAFLREITGENPCPEYSGFNMKQARESGQQPRAKTSVVYTPFLDMAPTEPDTMKTAMFQAQYITSLTGQEWTIFTCDQQLYQIAVNISWKDRELFSKFVPRLGGMHMLMSFVGAIGSLMAGSGLEDILMSTFAGVPKLLSGKKFPENVRALRIVVEELLRPLLMSEEVALDNIDKILECKSGSSRTTKLWVDCLIKPVLITMLFVRAERESDWPLHMLAVEKMLPYFFASGHVNYARYGLYYLRSMQRLHPKVLEKFVQGEHVMHHQDGLWNGIWSDLFIETTYMRYGKGPSGIIGSTLNDTTLAIWALSLSIFGQMKMNLEEMQKGEVQKVVTCHKEERYTRIKEDAADRQKIRDTLSTCIDVFDGENHPTTKLVNIFTGHIADNEAVNVDMSVKIGTEQWHEYEKQWPTGFHNRLSKKVKAMASVTKKKINDRSLEHVDTELIYARVIGIMASSRETVSTETLFSYELSTFPSALFDKNGNMRSTSKSVLKTKIKVECSQRHQVPAEVVLLDGCAILWTLPWPASPAKVSALITAAIARIMYFINTTQVLHVVFDRYYEMSIKSYCRTERAKGYSRVYKLTEHSPLPKQAITLGTTANKEQIIKLIVEKLRLQQVPEGKKVIVTGPEASPIDIGTGVQEKPVTHEEADVLLAYHMINEAVAGHSPIKVVSDDTDVLVILAHHMYMHTNNMPDAIQVFMESCSGNRSVIDVNKVVEKHSKVMPNILAAHALTGCDTVSSLAGIGKTTVLKKLETFKEILKLGEPSDSLDDVMDSCLKYVASLYGQKDGESLDTMRSVIFTRKIGGKRHVAPKLSSLPPTMAAFKLHCARAHYQTMLWKSAGVPSPSHLDPQEFGWEKKSSILQPIYLTKGQLIAPMEVLSLIRCGCKTGCKSAHCSCAKYVLACTEFCACRGDQGCENPTKQCEDTSDCTEEEVEDDCD